MRRAVVTSLALVCCVCSSERPSYETAPPGFGANDAGSECSLRRCSRDLHAVLSGCGDEDIIETCDPDKACANGACQPACSAAVAAAGSIGCDFWTVSPSAYDMKDCFVAFVANAWSVPTTLRASFGATEVDLSASARILTADPSAPYAPYPGVLEPGQVAGIFLATYQTVPSASPSKCPDGIQPTVKDETLSQYTGIRRAFHIQSSSPVSAYSIYPFGGALSYIPSATLLLPVGVWDGRYIVVNPWKGQGAFGTTTQIIASEADTEVTVIPSVDFEASNGAPAGRRGEPVSMTLGPGDVWQIRNPLELTGTTVQASKPVALLGGHECMSLPDGICCCDSANQQLFPVNTWGTRYAAVPYGPRANAEYADEKYFWRIVAASEGTKLSYRPYRPPEARSSLGANEMQTFWAKEPFIVESQDSEHPIAVFAYMSAGRKLSMDTGMGDPDFVNVVPVDQYLSRYVFYVDHTYALSRLVVVRRRENGVFSDVTIDCGSKKIEGFKGLDEEGEYEYAYVPIQDKPREGECGPGRHEASSAGPFAVTVWGMANWASYAYPAGAGLRPINEVKPAGPH